MNSPSLPRAPGLPVNVSVFRTLPAETDCVFRPYCKIKPISSCFLLQEWAHICHWQAVRQKISSSSNTKQFRKIAKPFTQRNRHCEIIKINSHWLKSPLNLYCTNKFWLVFYFEGDAAIHPGRVRKRTKYTFKYVTFFFKKVKNSHFTFKNHELTWMHIFDRN